MTSKASAFSQKYSAKLDAFKHFCYLQNIKTNFFDYPINYSFSRKRLDSLSSFFFFFLAKQEITYLVSVHWRRNISLQNYSGKLSLKLSNEYFPVKIPVKNDTQGWGNCTQCRSFEFILVSSKRWPFFDTARISCLSKICTGNDKSISIHMPICSLSTLNLSQSIQD